MGSACGRNYFSRPSAPLQESFEDAEERARILEEAKQLKKLAVDYLHPELPVQTTDPSVFGRNYYDRPSAVGHSRNIHTYPAHEDDINHDEHNHDHFEHFHMDEDLAVASSVPAKAPKTNDAIGQELEKEEEEGKLSRSPSSVMLLTEESVCD